MTHATRPLARRTSVLALAAAATLLVGCSQTGTQAPAGSAAPQGAGTTTGTTTGDEGDVLAAHDLEGMSGAEIVDHLDAMPRAERPDDLLASVRTDAVVLSEAGGPETSVPLPEDSFYLSVAPYAQQTHECFYHALTGCVGEMYNEDVHVNVVDSDGNVVVDEDTTTFDNGFVGVWLPRDIEGTVTVTTPEGTGTSEISTGEDDLTCLTSLRVS